ncbi:MAG: zinc ribbon domain-containing protein [Candidatus Hermodarchaeota archaeon]
MKSKYYIMIVILSLIPLLFSTTIPFATARRLYLNTPLVSEHTRRMDPKLYVVSLQEGVQYTIDIYVSSSWGLDIAIKISDRPYALSGYIVDTDSYVGDIMNFLASRTGDYYILVKAKSGSGFFDIRVDFGITNPATGPMTKFFGGMYSLILILPSAIIFLVGMFILLLIRKKQQDSVNKKDLYTKTFYQEKKVEKDALEGKGEVRFCPFCGHKIERLANYCSNCGNLIT